MIYFWILAGLALLLLAIVAFRLRHRRLSAGVARTLRAQWAAAAREPDPARRVLEADKVLDALLAALGYTGSTADKLRAAGPRLPEREALWAAHKLRNRIAHEPGIKVSEQDATRAVRSFKQALTQFVGDSL